MTRNRLAIQIAVSLSVLGVATPVVGNDVRSAVVVAGASGTSDTAMNASGSTQADPANREVKTGNRDRASVPVLWVPRAKRGAPAARMGGASRSTGQEGLVVLALVPEIDEAALTLSEQPTLQWHLSARTVNGVNFTLVDPEAVEPLVDATLGGPFPAGFHTVSLSDYDVRLEPGRRYEWYVAVVADPERRSADTVARGSILRVSEPALEAKVAEADPAARLDLLTGAGIWYDALESTRVQLEQSPQSPAARARRDALLAQVGIELDE